MTDEPLTPATPNVSTRKCRRHQWISSIDQPEWHCKHCPAVRDEAVVRRNRNNRQRGSTFERSVAKQLGGRRTGPLGGRDDVMVGQFAAIQTKKDGSLSLNGARAYLDDLARTYPERVPLVVHARPGPKPDPVVILPLSWWRELHGELE
jgi:hypothetical protein